MKNDNTTNRSIFRRLRRVAGVTALAMAFTLAVSTVTHAQTVTPPVVPAGLEVLEPNEAFLIGHSFGTQNYECQPAASLGRVAWTLFTPQATLLSDFGDQLTTHFFSPNPDEVGIVIRATWQDSTDTSTVWAKATGVATVDPTAIPWVRLQVVGARRGPTSGDTLSRSTFVQRVNTEGGLAPTTGCDQPVDAGRKAFMPYTADYVFYRVN
jgi:hypothetical protein